MQTLAYLLLSETFQWAVMSTETCIYHDQQNQTVLEVEHKEAEAARTAGEARLAWGPQDIKCAKDIFSGSPERTRRVNPSVSERRQSRNI